MARWLFVLSTFFIHLSYTATLLQQCYQPIYYTVISFWKGRPGEGRRLWKKTQKSFMKHPAHKVIPYMTMDNGTSYMCNKVHIHLESAHYSVGRAGWSQPPALGHPHHLQKLFLSCKKKDLNASVLSECYVIYKESHIFCPMQLLTLNAGQKKLAIL